jgi:uncharacterized protein (TIGR03089 family)
VQPRPSQTPTGLLAARLAEAGAQPLVTFYDDSSGERVELSGATLANWVAKTAGLLTDTIDVRPADLVRLQLPRHWLTAAWALATWRVGAVLQLDESKPDLGPGRLLPGQQAAVTVCPDSLAGSYGADAGVVVAVSLRPMGVRPGPAQPDAGVLDFAREVAQFPDVFDGPQPSAADPALAHAGRVWTGAQLVQDAAAAAARWRAGPAARLLLADELDPVEEPLALTVVPLLVAGSVVACAQPDPARLGERAITERVTAWCTPATDGRPQR